VDVVGHDDEGVEGELGKSSGKPAPDGVDDGLDVGVFEEELSIVGADGDEVGAGPVVVVGGKANGAAMVGIWVVGHGWRVAESMEQRGLGAERRRRGGGAGVWQGRGMSATALTWVVRQALSLKG
jgi:hypothetical protein